MASSGTINNTFRTGYAIRITWSVGSQSVANNTSSVTANVQLVSLGASYTINSSATKNGSVTINGTSYSFTFNASLTGNQVKTIHTRTVTVAHNANGTKTCSFSCSAGINVTLSGTYYGNVTASGSGVFNTIARATTPTLSAASTNIGSAVTINTPRAASGFTHTLTYAFGSRNGTIATGVGTSVSWTLPMDLCNAIPNASSGVGTITCATYSGSTLIGTKSVSFTGIVPSSVVPTISAVSLSEAVSGLATQFQGYVQNKSKLAVSVTATGVYSSTIASYRITVDGTVYTARTFTSGVLKNSGSRTVSIQATDSRGRTASTTRTVTVIAYAPPAISSLSGFRSTSSGVENYEGTNARIAAAFIISPVGNRNVNTYRFEYKLQSASNWTALTNGTGYAYNTGFTTGAVFGQDSSFDVRLSVTDYFGTVSKTIEISTAFTLIDYNASGRSIAFGKVSELAHGVEFGMPTYFSNAETPNGAISLATGTNLNNIVRPGYYAFSSAVLATMTNCPVMTGASGCVMVHSIGEAGQLMQLAIRCSDVNAEIWQRFYYSSTWRAWRKIYQNRKMLWTGALYMTATHNAALAEKVSEQQSGIVLVFSRYSSGVAQNYHYNEFFVHKEFVASHPGSGSQFFMTTDGSFSVICSKYLYVHDDRITGNAVNSASGTNNGITYNNGGFVLRYVIGV